MSSSLFDGSPAAEAPAASCSCRSLWKIGVVILLVVAVIAVVFAKGRPRPGAGPAPAALPAGSPQPELLQTASAASLASERVLATVNGKPITEGELETALAELPAEARGAYAQAKHEFLEELIALELLLQQARGPSEGSSPAPTGADALRVVREFIQSEVLSRVTVTDADLRSFYDEHKGELPSGMSFEQVADRLRPYVENIKRQEAVEAYLDELRSRAEIARDQAWLDEQKALAADNPLDRALATGRPVVVDFGRGSCTPCKMMAPVLEDLKGAYAGKAEIVFIQVDDYPALTQRSEIRAIPTQIFYDQAGKEVYRHEGFMPRADIVAKLAEMGVQ